MCVNLDINSEFSDKIEDILMITNTLVLVLSYVVVIIVQKKIIDFTKDMNPEKEAYSMLNSLKSGKKAVMKLKDYIYIRPVMLVTRSQTVFA